jgi:hypothetical protein
MLVKLLSEHLLLVFVIIPLMLEVILSNIFKKFISYLTEHGVSITKISYHELKRPTVFEGLDLPPFSGGQGKVRNLR